MRITTASAVFFSAAVLPTDAATKSHPDDGIFYAVLDGDAAESNTGRVGTRYRDRRSMISNPELEKQAIDIIKKFDSWAKTWNETADSNKETTKTDQSAQDWLDELKVIAKAYAHQVTLPSRANSVDVKWERTSLCPVDENGQQTITINEQTITNFVGGIGDESALSFNHHQGASGHCWIYSGLYVISEWWRRTFPGFGMRNLFPAIMEELRDYNETKKKKYTPDYDGKTKKQLLVRRYLKLVKKADELILKRLQPVAIQGGAWKGRFGGSFTPFVARLGKYLGSLLVIRAKTTQQRELGMRMMEHALLGQIRSLEFNGRFSKNDFTNFNEFLDRHRGNVHHLESTFGHGIGHATAVWRVDGTLKSPTLRLIDNLPKSRKSVFGGWKYRYMIRVDKNGETDGERWEGRQILGIFTLLPPYIGLSPLDFPGLKTQLAQSAMRKEIKGLKWKERIEDQQKRFQSLVSKKLFGNIMTRVASEMFPGSFDKVAFKISFENDAKAIKTANGDDVTCANVYERDCRDPVLSSPRVQALLHKPATSKSPHPEKVGAEFLNQVRKQCGRAWANAQPRIYGYPLLSTFQIQNNVSEPDNYH
jgi:hypothetical protein